MRNLEGGGDCSIFEIIDEIKTAFRNYPQIQESILMTLKADILLIKDEQTKEL